MNLMTRRLILLICVFSMLLVPNAGMSAANKPKPIQLFIDGIAKTTSISPTMIGNTVYVPLKQVAQTWKSNVAWNGRTKEITVRKDGNTFVLQLNKKSALKNKRPITLNAAPVIIKNTTMVPVRFISEGFGAQVSWNAGKSRVSIFNHADQLPLIGSVSNFKKMLAKQFSEANTTSSRLKTGEFSPISLPTLNTNTGTGGLAGSAPEASSPQSDQKSTNNSDFSQTNTQVAGVDEADVIKTDGSHIYQVRNNEITITKVYPSEQMEVINQVKFGDDPNFVPSEMYVSGGKLVVIGYTSDEVKKMPAPPESTFENKIMPIASDVWYGGPIRNITKLYVFDITNPSKLKTLREFKLDANYVSSRKIGSQVYLIANKYFYYYPSTQGDIAAPRYYDSAVGNSWQSVDFSEIRYFPDTTNQQYLMIAGIDVDRFTNSATLTTFLGSGEQVYASTENLYITLTKYEFEQQKITNNENRPTGALIRAMWWMPSKVSTTIYKFSLEQGIVNFVAKGSAPGSLLNQFSMDEHDGHFRIATTKTEFSDGAAPWQGELTNQMYVLDEQLKMKGKLENIAPEERIYSVRYVGERAYMVTFKTVDPLFVIDLSNPAKPTILGELKIPGFSNYLHPYDENHIIGIGKDTVERSITSIDPITGEKFTNTFATVGGMKIALFDVSDVNNPREKFVEIIGANGTYSELLHNHKALLFSREKNLFALPITVYEDKDDSQMNNGWNSSTLTFQGAYVYSLDLENGFQLKSKISHYESNESFDPYTWWYNSDRNIRRILYIKDMLYTISDKKIQANYLDTYKYASEVPLPTP